jgi:hypothetical protein
LAAVARRRHSPYRARCAKEMRRRTTQSQTPTATL